MLPRHKAAIAAAAVVTFVVIVMVISAIISDSGGTFEASPSTSTTRSTPTTTAYSTPSTTRSTTRATTTAPTTTTSTTTSTATSTSTRTTTTTSTTSTQVTNEYSVIAITPMTCSGTPVSVYADGAQQNMGIYGSPKLTTTVNGALLTFAAKPQGFSFSKLIMASDAGNVFSGDGADFSSTNINGPTNIRIASSYTPYAVTMC